jgi:hypothetical protein
MSARQPARLTRKATATPLPNSSIKGHITAG